MASFASPPRAGTLARVTTVETSRGETRHLLPQFLPDGRRFLYVAGSNRPGGSMLYVASLDLSGRTAVRPADSTVMFVTNRAGGSEC